MPVSIIVGGQFGSEGKGKVAHYFAKKYDASVAVRVGGPNSGHTVYDKNGNKFIFRTLPTAALLDGITCVLPAGAYVDLNILHQEIRMVDLSFDRLIIDPNAVIISQLHKETEADLIQQIGSTGSGTGSAHIARLRRNNQDRVMLARDCLELKDCIQNTKDFMRNELEKDKHIVIEGTQGFGLSVLHSKYYPYTTSRDTSSAGFLSETGLSPFDVENIIMVIRSFPIRVSGNSGPLPKETTWEAVSKAGNFSEPIIEYTSATNRIRRVAHFDEEIVIEAIRANRPNIIVMNHLDYLDNTIRNKTTITGNVTKFVEQVEVLIGTSINYIGNSPVSLIQR